MINIFLNSNWLFEQAKINGNKLAVLSNQIELTYEQLYEKVKEKTSVLSIAINENDIVGIPAEHSHQFIIDLFAIWSLGATVLPINPKLKQDEIDKQLSFTDCKIISNSQVTETKRFTTRSYNPEKSALIMFTSGSTGKQKAVQHTFKSLYSSANLIDNAISFEPQEKWLASLPFYRIGGFQIILRSLLSGGTLCIPDSVQSDNILKSISLYEPNYISLVNASLKIIVESEIKEVQNSKAIFIGGGPVDSNLMKEGLNKELPLYKVYGSTETGSMISVLSPEKPDTKLESAGKPLPGVKIKIIDDEVCVSADSLFTGYYRNQKLTKVKIKDGLFFTGDNGYIDKDGFLYIKNRKDNLIISGGEKIDPKEIEDELMNFDGINQAVVLGIHDEKWGQKVCAVIVGKSELDVQVLRDKLKQKLPSYKIPKEIRQIEELPKDEMGKSNLLEIKKLFT